MYEQTIAAATVAALFELAVSKGASRTALATRSGIAPGDLTHGDSRLALSRYVALMRAGQELCDDPALALHFGESVDITEISIACSVGGTRTFDEAFTQLNRYARLDIDVHLIEGGDRFTLVRQNGEVWIVDTRSRPNDFPELTESTFARMVCSARRLSGDRPVFKEVHVTHAEPLHSSEYRRVFGAPLFFGSDRNGLRIDHELVSSWRFPASPRYVTAVLRDHAEALLRRLEESRSTRGRVESVLAPLLPTGDANVGTVAQRLGLSRQTLFRRLRSEGVTFRQVLDELRHKTALYCLMEEKVSVKKTARLVGFSDAAAFSRAFTRWTGSSPGAHVRVRAGPA
jgi:AraC-like DNA-binding protein